jgi:hypothetical protein
MRRGDFVRCWSAGALFAIVVFALARVGAAQEERQAVEKAETTDTTLYPVPNYGGNVWSRSYLTGDWGGLRSRLADRGVQFEFNVTQIFQDVASGGTNRTGRYSGLTDIVPTYPIFCADETLFLPSVISTGFTRSTFVLGTFWARGLSERVGQFPANS